MLCCAPEKKPLAPRASLFIQDRAEAIEAANATEFGLASYCYSRDVGRIFLALAITDEFRRIASAKCNKTALTQLYTFWLLLRNAAFTITCPIRFPRG